MVIVAKVMMATDPQWYRDGLEFVRRNRRWEEQNALPSSLKEAQARPLSTPPLEDPLTASFARCFARILYHPDFGLPRPTSHRTYILGMILFIYYIHCSLLKFMWKV